MQAVVECADKHTIPVDRFSSFKKIVSVSVMVFRFVNNLKCSLKRRNLMKYKHFNVHDPVKLYGVASDFVIATEQMIHYGDIFRFLRGNNSKLKAIPVLVTRLNLFIDGDVLKVKSKFDRWRDDPNFSFPILLCRDSKFTSLIIHDTRLKMSHFGCYYILTKILVYFNLFDMNRRLNK